MSLYQPFTSLADIAAIERVPLDDRQMAGSTLELLRNSAEQFGDRTAIRFLYNSSGDASPAEVSFNQLYGDVIQIANLFKRLGVTLRDSVTLLMPNLPEQLVAMWAAQAAAVANPVNPDLPIETIASIMRSANTKVLIAPNPVSDTKLWDKISALTEQVPGLRAILTVDQSRHLPWDKRLAWRLMPQRRKLARPVTVGDLMQMAREQPRDRLMSVRKIDRKSVAAMFHTGGTTGEPKLAQLSHQNQTFAACSIASTGPFNQNARILCGLPFYHAPAAIQCALGSIAAGSTLLIAGRHGFRDRAMLDNFWALAARERINAFFTVPPLLSKLMDQDRSGLDLSQLKYVFCGAGRVAPDLFKRFEDETGMIVVETYGLTEGSSVNAINPPYGQRRIGSLGLRLPYQEIKTVVVDMEGKYVRDAKVGEPGLIAIRGPSVFAGYLDPRLNSSAFFDDGWLKTDDVGKMDSDGYLWMVGRWSPPRRTDDDDGANRARRA